MTRYTPHILMTLALVAVSAAAQAQAQAQTGPATERGQLLYNTHCVACHDKQMHWRQNKKATDWVSLVAQVRRWQATEKLSWNDEDIKQVALYLNDTIYRYPLARLAQRE